MNLGGPLFVKRQKKYSEYVSGLLMCKSLHWKSVSIKHSSCLLFWSSGCELKVQLLIPAALRSCKVFGSLYFYFWWIPSFASSCNEWKSACCIVSFCRLTICTMHVVIERSWKGVMKVEFFAFMFCMTHNASDVNSYADSVFGACALKIDS